MGLGHFSNNVTIKNEAQHLIIGSATSGSGTTTSSAVLNIPDSGCEWILNGSVHIATSGSSANRFIQFTYNGGTNWFDIDVRFPNLTGQGTTGATEVKLLLVNFPMGLGAGFRLSRSNATGSDSIFIWATATRKQNTP